MTQHPPRLPTLDLNLKDLDQDQLKLILRLRTLDLATRVLSHPIMMKAAKEAATKKTTSPIDPSAPEISTLSTDMPEWHVSFGMPTIASQTDWSDSLAISSQLPIARSSRNTIPTSMSTTLLLGKFI